MENVPVKVTGDNLTAVEYNTGLQTEAKNAVITSGQTLAGGDLYQLSKSMSIYSAAGDFYTDSGSANNYVLSPNASMQAPIQYVDGMSARFRIAHTNTGASQVNVNSLGLKDILRKDRVSPVSPGDLPINQHAELIFHDDIDAFTLSDTLADVIISSQTWGLILSNSAGDLTHDIAISAGGAVDNLNSYLLLNTGIIKQVDANWAAGTNAGGFPSGLTLTPGTWYHLFLIGKTNGITDAGFDTSLTATNLLSDATGYTKYKLIGSVYYTSAPALRLFLMDEDGTIYWKDGGTNNFTGAGSITRSLITLSTPPGRSLSSEVSFGVVNSQYSYGTSLWIGQISIDDISLASGYDGIFLFGTDIIISCGTTRWIRTDTSSRIAYKLSAAINPGVLYIKTLGWKEKRI